MNYLIGIGNYRMGDDAIGLLLVEALADKHLVPGFETVNIVDDGLKLLSYFDAKTQTIAIVDCVDFGGRPGDTAIFSPDDVQSDKALSGFSTHEGDLVKIIELGKELGYPIPKITVIGIQPLSLAEGVGISPALSAKFDGYLDLIRQTCQEMT